LVANIQTLSSGLPTTDRVSTTPKSTELRKSLSSKICSNINIFVDNYYQGILKNVNEMKKEESKSMRSILSKHNLEMPESQSNDNMSTLNIVQNFYDNLIDKIESLKNIKSFEKIISEKNITLANSESNRTLVP